jgi:hypothetical protein
MARLLSQSISRRLTGDEDANDAESCIAMRRSPFSAAARSTGDFERFLRVTSAVSHC